MEGGAAFDEALKTAASKNPSAIAFRECELFIIDEMSCRITIKIRRSVRLVAYGVHPKSRRNKTGLFVGCSRSARDAWSLDQSMLNGVVHQFRVVFHAHFFQYSGAVCADGFDA